MYSYVLIVVAAASGTPAAVTTHDFRDLAACETAQEFVLRADPSKRDSVLWKEQSLTARCVLSQEPK